LTRYPVTTFFISRHPGAIAWATQQRLKIDRFLTHLDPGVVRPGDTVIGTLPIHLAAQVCELGGRYFHLALDLPDELRGRELSAEEITAHGGRVERYRVARETGTLREDVTLP